MVIWQVFSLTEIVYNDTSLLKRQPESKEEGSIEKTKFKPYIPSCFEIKSTNRRNLNKTYPYFMLCMTDIGQALWVTNLRPAISISNRNISTNSSLDSI